MSSSKRYPEEFKVEAVKQMIEKGHSVAEVAKRLGTTTHSLYAWISGTICCTPVLDFVLGGV